MLRIAIQGWAAVFNDTDEQITDAAILRGLDGLHYNDEYLTDYLGGSDLEDSVAKALERSGTLRFEFVENRDVLRVTTELIAKRDLSQEELDCLVKHTLGQWSDGMGENFTCESEKRCGYTVMCLDEHEVAEAEYPFLKIERDNPPNHSVHADVV